MASNPSLAARLREAATWLGDDIPPNTREIGDLDGDVKLDELDLYCVNLLSEAADALSTPADQLASNPGELAEESGFKPEWRPIESAPKDGTWVIAIVGGASERWEYLNGRAFVVRHDGETSSGFDRGWSVFPGFGGAGDHWFTHWMPLPTAPTEVRGAEP